MTMEAALANDELVSRYSVDNVIVWPVSIGQIKKNAQVPHEDDDELLTDPDAGIIARAVDYVEALGRVALITQTRRVTFDGGFPAEIETRWPLQSVTSAAYLDDDYATQTVDPANYRALTAGKPGRVLAKSSISWPTPIYEPESVVLTYKAGFGDNPSSVPPRWKTPIIVLASYWWGNREAFNSLFVSQPFYDSLKDLIGIAGGMVRYV